MATMNNDCIAIVHAKVIVAKWVQEDLGKSEDTVLDLVALLDEDVLLVVP